MAMVLLVEDEEIILNEVVNWMAFEDYEVLLARNGREGLEMAVQHIPDVIISDVRMPLMDGRELLTALRNNDATKHIPFIFATASADERSVQRGLEIGANAYITKPFVLTDILDIVAKWVNK